MKRKENLVDEGLRIDLVKTAFFDGKFEIPHINKPKNFTEPQGMVPFSNRERSIKLGYNDYVCFYEYDINFREILTNTEEYIEDLKRFPGIITPDCSLYIDSPLIVQIVGIYLNRAIGAFLQSKGLNVIPNIRWGDERTYTSTFLGEKVAFAGVEKYSVVSIGTYGQIKSKESKRYFREGLTEMIKELKPKTVLVYGPMPDSIFKEFKDKTKFIQYNDWIKRMKTK